jgi:hypothetical protein
MPWRNPFNYPGPRNPDGSVKTWELARDKRGNPLPEPHIWMYSNQENSYQDADGWWNAILRVEQGSKHVTMHWSHRHGWSVNGKNLHAHSWNAAARAAIATLDQEEAA